MPRMVADALARGAKKIGEVPLVRAVGRFGIKDGPSLGLTRRGFRAGREAFGGRTTVEKRLAPHLEGRFMGNHPRMKRAAGFASRHPMIIGGAAVGYGLNARGFYSRMPGPNRSRRNQNSMFLRNFRSSGTTGLPGNSIGGYTGGQY